MRPLWDDELDERFGVCNNFCPRVCYGSRTEGKGLAGETLEECENSSGTPFNVSDVKLDTISYWEEIFIRG